MCQQMCQHLVRFTSDGKIRERPDFVERCGLCMKFHREIGGAAQVQADADDGCDAWPVGWLMACGAGELDQDTGELAILEQQVVRPFEADAGGSQGFQRSGQGNTDGQGQTGQ